MVKKNLSVFFVVTTLAVAGCDQVAQLGALVGLAPKREVVRRSPKPPSTPRPTPTPRPAATPRRTPQPDPNAGPTIVATPIPGTTKFPEAPIVDTTPTPVPSPTGPWLTAQLVDKGNGLQKLEITGSGGFGRNDRADIFAMLGLDGQVYLLVYRWTLPIWGEHDICDIFPEIYGGSEAAVFVVRGIEDREILFDYVAKPGVDTQALRAGWDVYGWCHGGGEIYNIYYEPAYRIRLVESLRAFMPAMESLDVVSIPSSDEATASALLGEQAEARWGKGRIPFAGLPLYPFPEKYPRRLERFIDMGVTVPPKPLWEQTAGIQVDHAVGNQSAFAFRWEYWRWAPKYCRDESWVYFDCWTTYMAPTADFNPLWRMNKGEATWKSLQVVPRKQSTWLTSKIELEIQNRWNQVLWSDLHKRWFFWIGAATGSVYIATEDAAAELK